MLDGWLLGLYDLPLKRCKQIGEWAKRHLDGRRQACRRLEEERWAHLQQTRERLKEVQQAAEEEEERLPVMRTRAEGMPRRVDPDRRPPIGEQGHTGDMAKQHLGIQTGTEGMVAPGGLPNAAQGTTLRAPYPSGAHHAHGRTGVYGIT